MKTILLILLLTCAAFAQAPDNFWAAGVSYNPGASPAVSGTGLYAKQVSATTKTYSFTVLDALPTSVKPFVVSTQVSTGVAQQLLTVNGISIFVPVSVGISYSGGATGWSWTTGGMAAIPIKTSKWIACPTVRVVKSSVSNGADYQLIAGILFGRGN